MQSQESYRIGPGLRVKLRQMVDEFDGRVMGGSGGDIPVRLQGMLGGGGDRERIRLGKVEQSWAKGTSATITQLNGDGSLMAGSPTFTAMNHFADIFVDCGVRKVACGKVDTTWILIASECGL